MKSQTIKILLGSLMVMLWLSAPCIATPFTNSQTPSTRADEMLKKIRSAQNLQPALSYVHWDTAYQQLNASQRALLQVNSAALLKQRASEILKNPNIFLRKQIQMQMGLDSLQGMQANVVETMIDSQVPILKAGIDSEIQKILRYPYHIAEQKVLGSKAGVLVKYGSPSEAKELVLHYVLINGEWWLNPEHLKQMSLGRRLAGI
jgi:hypothetical protein